MQLPVLMVKIWCSIIFVNVEKIVAEWKCLQKIRVENVFSKSWKISSVWYFPRKYFQVKTFCSGKASINGLYPEKKKIICILPQTWKMPLVFHRPSENALHTKHKETEIFFPSNKTSCCVWERVLCLYGNIQLISPGRFQHPNCCYSCSFTRVYNISFSVIFCEQFYNLASDTVTDFKGMESSKMTRIKKKKRGSPELPKITLTHFLRMSKEGSW